VERYGPGEEAAAFEPGDFILTHADHVTSRLIRFAQRWRMRGARREFAHWSHAAIGLRQVAWKHVLRISLENHGVHPSGGA
jgi:hypothetical protein